MTQSMWRATGAKDAERWKMSRVSSESGLLKELASNEGFGSAVETGPLKKPNPKP